MNRELIDALAKLALEAQHFADNRIGEQFLRGAIENANEVLQRARAIVASGVPPVGEFESDCSITRGVKVVKICPDCKLSFDAAEWDRLSLPYSGKGTQVVEADETEPAYTLSLRNCECGSTLAIKVLS